MIPRTVEAARFDLDTQQTVPVRNGRAIVDVDRKSGQIFRVLQ